MEKREWIINIAAIVLIVSVFLTWAYGSSFLDPSMNKIPINGLQIKFGYATGLAGIIILGLFLFRKQSKTITIIAGAVSSIMALIFWYYITNISEITRISEINARGGIGLYLTLIAGIVILVCGIFEKKGTKTKKTKKAKKKRKK